LSMIKSFPSHTVGFVSSGTGFAGIAGTLTLLILQGIGMKNQFIFLCAIPSYFVYLYVATWLNGQKNKYPFVNLSSNNNNGSDIELLKDEKSEDS